MTSITNNPDTDRLIAMNMDYRTLLSYCLINKYYSNTVCNDDFFYNRLQKDYPDTINYNYNNEPWKIYALKTIGYINKMKEDFGYVYTFGNPSVQYDILKTRHINDRFIEYSDDYDIEDQKHNYLLVAAVNSNEKALVLEALRRGADINANEKDALLTAIEMSNLDMVKFLVSQGARINNDALITASEKGHLDILKYLKSAKKRK